MALTGQRGFRDHGDTLAVHWVALDSHFQRHARLVDRFRKSDGKAVLSMWRSQTNEDGQLLSRFEREALIERHCELFGTWPVCAPRRGVNLHTLADLELANLRIVESQRRIAEQRRRVTEQERNGQDWRLSRSVLVNFEATLELMVAHRNAIARELNGVGPN